MNVQRSVRSMTSGSWNSAATLPSGAVTVSVTSRPRFSRTRRTASPAAAVTARAGGSVWAAAGRARARTRSAAFTARSADMEDVRLDGRLAGEQPHAVVTGRQHPQRHSQREGVEPALEQALALPDRPSLPVFDAGVERG